LPSASAPPRIKREQRFAPRSPKSIYVWHPRAVRLPDVCFENSIYADVVLTEAMSAHPYVRNAAREMKTQQLECAEQLISRSSVLLAG
jgi:hypothetical protein